MIAPVVFLLCFFFPYGSSHASLSIMWKPANPWQAGADWQTVAVGSAVCSLLQKWLEGTNEQGSVNDRNWGILRLWRGQAFFQWIKPSMAGNHSFSSERCNLLNACNTWRQPRKIPQTEVQPFVCCCSWLYMDLSTWVLYLTVRHRGAEHEEEIPNCLALHGIGDNRSSSSCKHVNQTQFLTLFMVVIYIFSSSHSIYFDSVRASLHCSFHSCQVCYSWAGLKLPSHAQGIHKRRCMCMVQNYPFESH